MFCVFRAAALLYSHIVTTETYNQLLYRHDTEAGYTCNVTIVKGNKVYASIVEDELIAIISIDTYWTCYFDVD